jgi:hypothetical protein
MLKNILKLEGVQKLTKNEQKTISGGLIQCYKGGVCIEFSNRCAELKCRFLDPLD